MAQTASVSEGCQYPGCSSIKGLDRHTTVYAEGFYHSPYCQTLTAAPSVGCYCCPGADWLGCHAILTSAPPEEVNFAGIVADALLEAALP